MGEAACTSLAAHQLVSLGYTASAKGLLPLYPQHQTRSVLPQAMALRARKRHWTAHHVAACSVELARNNTPAIGRAWWPHCCASNWQTERMHCSQLSPRYTISELRPRVGARRARIQELRKHSGRAGRKRLPPALRRTQDLRTGLRWLPLNACRWSMLQIAKLGPGACDSGACPVSNAVHGTTCVHFDRVSGSRAGPLWVQAQPFIPALARKLGPQCRSRTDACSFVGLKP